MGGIIIFPIVFVFILSALQDINHLRFFLLSSITLLACGVIDDLAILNWKKKFIIQGISVTFLLIYYSKWAGAISILGIAIPLPLSYILFFIFILGAINSINLMDGLDGLVSGYSSLVCISIFLLAYTKNDFLDIVISSSLLGTLIGLIKYNSYPADIFLGDTGSLILGLLLVFISLNTAIAYGDGYRLDIIFPIMLLGLPLTDTLKVIFLRLNSKKNPFLPDNNHLHYSLLNFSFRQKIVVFIIHSISILFIVTALFYLKSKNLLFVIPFAILCLIIFFDNIILKRLKGTESLRNILKNVLLYPSIIISTYKKYLVVISTLFYILLLISTFHLNKTIEHSVLLLLLIGGVIILSLSILHNKRKNSLIPIYVYFNILFLLLLNTNIFPIHSFNIFSWLTINTKLYIYSLLVLLAVVLFFFIARDKIISKSLNFFSSFDLIILTLTSMLYLIQDFLPISKSEILLSLVFSLIIYFWFKVISFINSRISIYVYYSLFVVNFLIIILSFF